MANKVFAIGANESRLDNAVVGGQPVLNQRALGCLFALALGNVDFSHGARVSFRVIPARRTRAWGWVTVLSLLGFVAFALQILR